MWLLNELAVPPRCFKIVRRDGLYEVCRYEYLFLWLLPYCYMHKTQTPLGPPLCEIFTLELYRHQIMLIISTVLFCSVVGHPLSSRLNSEGSCTYIHHGYSGWSPRNVLCSLHHSSLVPCHFQFCNVGSDESPAVRKPSDQRLSCVSIRSS